jgi:predicted ester cyclase
MSTEQNKTIIRRIPEELFNQGNLAVADEVFALDYISHRPFPPGWPKGIAGVKQYVSTLRTAFPDLRLTVEEILAEGDKVAVQVTISGTQTGPFMGIPATGKSAVWTEMHLCRMADSKLAEHWVNADQLGLLQQLEAIPTPERV